MPPTPATLTAMRRETLGKEVAKLRAQGRLPAVVFGHGVDSVPVSLDAHEFEQLRRHHHGNALIDLQIDGESRRVLLHGIQVDPRTRKLLHVDLFAIKAGEEVHAEVPVVTVGDSEAVKHGGVLLHTVDRVRVRALPENLPEEIAVSIESLTSFDDAIYVRDLTLPAGVTLLTDPDEIVAKVQAPHAPEVEAVPAEAAEAEGGAEAPAEEGQTSGSDRPERAAPEG